MKKMKYIIIIFILFIRMCLVSASENYTKAIINIDELTIEQIQVYLDKGYLTSEQLVQLYLERIEKYNVQYHAFISINDNALETAKELDNERTKKGSRGQLHGIPIVIKDNYDFVGLPTTAGAQALFDSYPKNNSFVVQKLIDAGAIILGKTNMSSFALIGYASISSYATTRNAYNVDYSSYGSSGGTAVAVASNLAVVGLGTDTNSSVRGPSSANNIVGLRPTYGLISRTGILPYASDRDTAGPMTRTVTDLATLLDFIVGTDEDDPVTKNADINIPKTYTSYLNKDGLKGKKIGIINDFTSANSSSSIPVLKYYYSGIKKLVDKAIADLNDAGAEIIYIDNFYTNYLNNLFSNSLDGFTFCYDLNNYFDGIKESKIKSFNDLVKDGRLGTSISEYGAFCSYNPRETNGYETILSNKEKYKKYVQDIIDKYALDAFAYPSLKNKLITAYDSSSQVGASTSHTIAPTIGYPSIVVPMGFDEGLPYGLEITSEPYTEGKLIGMAYAYEQVSKNRKEPSISPSLYDVPEDVTKLISKVEYVEEKINLNDYTKKSSNNLSIAFNDAKTYLTDCNNSKLDPSLLLLDLNDSINELKKTSIIEKFLSGLLLMITNYIIEFIAIAVIIILIFCRLIFKKKYIRRH